MEEIKNLEKLFESFLNGTKQIQEYKIKRLTAAGENYGSIMLSLDLTIKNDNKIEQISTVVKKIPTNECAKKIFHIDLTFPNEIGFYKIIFPTIQQFLNNNNINDVNIDFVAKYYCSRLNLIDNDNDGIDDDAVLILENLKINNYINLPRTRGCCYQTTKLVLKALGQFHGILLALKLKQPELFNNNIKPYLLKFDIFDNKCNPNQKDDSEEKQQLCDMIGNIDGISQYKERVKNAIYNKDYSIKNENYATVIHNDLWTNNIMVKFINNQPVEIKIVDYQICTYGSITKDLLFYLFTSVENDICRQYLDDFIRYYYENFIDILKKFQCNLDNYDYQQFLNEIKIEAQTSQFHHILVMLIPIMATKVLEVSETEGLPMNNISIEHKEKLKFIVQEFVKHNWI